MGRKGAKIELSDAERAELNRLARRHKSGQALAMRARIVLAAADDRAGWEIAETLGINEGTVSKWRGRFCRDRIEGLSDAPRTGRPRTVSDEKIHDLISKTLKERPKGATHWSCRTMADHIEVSRSTVNASLAGLWFATTP